MLDILRVYRKVDGKNVSATKENCTFGFIDTPDLKALFKAKGTKNTKENLNHVFNRIREVYGLKCKGISSTNKNSYYFYRPLGLSIADCLPTDGNEEMPF